jgi:hypothetical protein
MKEGRKEGKRKKLMWVAAMQEARRRRRGGCQVELHTHNGCGLSVSRFPDFGEG